MRRRPNENATRPLTVIRSLTRWLLAALLVFAGLSHLFWARKGYRIVVPDWVEQVAPIDKDGVVVASGAAEVLLGTAVIALPRERRRVGVLIAAFFVAVFPGNVHQWRTGRPAPLMRTDRARFVRLFLQPVLVAWALWSTAPDDRAGRGGRRAR
ncbi:hypothetical protein [Agromyces aureus]|uniref:DoxX family protein n=1 Tax=Agromyces aureus TaxID=453304 RepID=A0A191WII5_9MICO|nr:hypothetical protein [Agromyces aureus]ANJ28071.1 hypothetical protein ATC03_16495 [Agromyces aureus]